MGPEDMTRRADDAPRRASPPYPLRKGTDHHATRETSAIDTKSGKLDSVWHNFRGAALATMRAPGRMHHPSRRLVDDLIRRWFDDRPFDWLDVGIMGMVDYERLRPQMRFRFVGADMSESILDDCRRYLRDPADSVVRWDLEERPAPELVGRFDLVTLRHVLNHCEYYDKPLEHTAQVLRPGGRCAIILHLALVDGPDQLVRHEDWEVPGEVVGNRYGRARFVGSLLRLFVVELWARVDGAKPNDVIVVRKPYQNEDARIAPVQPMRVRMPLGKLNAPVRAASRLLFRWRTRRLFAAAR